MTTPPSTAPWSAGRATTSRNRSCFRCYGSAYVICSSRRAERFMMHLAYHDSLTALPNREYFHQRLSEVLADPEIRAGRHAVMYIDLDQFKIVNDTCGHSAGDQLLRQLAHLLQTTL